jgi:subtilisin-like proprotein convertase family protein
MKKITLLGILLLCIGVMNAQQSEKVESFNREASLQNRNTSFTETASRYVGQRSTPSVLYDNGPIETSPGASTLQNSSLGMNFLGFGHQQAASNSIADDFMLTSDFSLNEITFYAYQTGSTTTSTITGVTLQIWDGVPGAAGSNVVWGDTSTNILSSTTWSGVYRDSETSVGDTNRPIMEVTVSTLGFIGTANTTYWLDWNVDGTLGSGPWAPPVTIIGQSTTGNGLQSLDGRTTWSSAEDSGTLTQQGFPFQLTGILFTQCATDNPQPIDDFTPVTSVVTLTQPGVIGAMTNQNTFEEALVQLQHDRAGDLVMTLTSPAGTVLELSSNNGGADGLDTQAGLFFIDGQPNITTWTGAPVDAAGYEAEGGSLMATFAGEPVAGDWTLTIEDGGLGDEGDLFGFCLTITNNGVVGTPPTISCPADIVVNSDEDGAGDCEAMVVFADAAAIDAEDGPIATTQTAGPASGDAFPVGDTDVTFEATDSDGNTVSCTFTVTVIDNEDPVAVCQDITVTLDEFGMASITEADIDGGSTDNCPAFTLSASQLTFGCSDVGDVVVILTITDASGNTDTCDATVTVVDDIAPV